MYAIIQCGGHQYRVAEGDTLDVERLDAADGDTVTFDHVLMVGGDAVQLGAPRVDGARVSATVLGPSKGKKITVFKYKPKNRYRVKQGHRQHYTRVRIDRIES